MSVTFAENLVEIKEYHEDKSIIKDKQNAFKMAKKCSNKTSRNIRNILYKHLPTEEQYLEKRNKGSRYGGIGFIEGYIGTTDKDYEIIYSNRGKKIRYNIYENDNGMMVAMVETKGFPGRKFYRRFIKSGDLYEELFKAEYKAKMFVITMVRKIFEDNDIM